MSDSKKTRQNAMPSKIFNLKNLLGGEIVEIFYIIEKCRSAPNRAYFK